MVAFWRRWRGNQIVRCGVIFCITTLMYWQCFTGTWVFVERPVNCESFRGDFLSEWKTSEALWKTLKSVSVCCISVMYCWFRAHLVIVRKVVAEDFGGFVHDLIKVEAEVHSIVDCARHFIDAFILRNCYYCLYLFRARRHGFLEPPEERGPFLIKSGCVRWSCCIFSSYWSFHFSRNVHDAKIKQPLHRFFAWITINLHTCIHTLYVRVCMLACVYQTNCAYDKNV